MIYESFSSNPNWEHEWSHLAPDRTAPQLGLLGDANFTHEAGTPFQDPGANWTDNADGSGEISGTGEVIADEPGEYLLTYQFSDQAGNAAQSLTRTVTVVDTTAPLIGLSVLSAVTLEAGTAYLDAGATFTDLVDGNGTFSGTGEVNSMVPGVYTIAFEFSIGGERPKA